MRQFVHDVIRRSCINVIILCVLVVAYVGTRDLVGVRMDVRPATPATQCQTCR